MKVKDLLLPHMFPDFKLIGGISALDREITNIAVFDTPDMSYWVQGGEFLIGNGFIFKDAISDLPIFLKKVARKDIAAIGLKFDRFAAFLDMAEIAVIADKLKLPVFRIPFRYRWLDIIIKVINEIDRLLGYEKRLISEGSFLAELDSMSVLLQEISARVHKPIFFSAHTEKEGSVFWPDTKMSFSSGESVDDYKCARIAETRFISGKSDFIGIREEFRLMKTKVVSRIYSTDSPLPFELHVIFDPPGRKLSGIEEKIATRGVYALKVLMAEQAGLSTLQHREISNTLERLVLGSHGNPDTLLQTLQKWDLVQPLPCRIAVIPRTDLYSDLIGHTDMPYRFCCQIGKFHVLLIPWEFGENSDKNGAAIKYLAKYEEPVGLGMLAASLEDIPKSFRDAERTVVYMQKAAMKKGVLFYEDVASKILLSGLSESEDASRIWLAYWAPLKTARPSLAVKLTCFAECLLEYNFSLVECAKKLDIHYNTARKYADTIEALLGVPLQDFKTQVSLLIAKKFDEGIS